ncbi:hypothetical protein [Jeotgalibaca porci]|uniref:hypothetical protein n=1 Tax=Jeotgalibaca porci TaxID=1868793 RepID=UPI0035A0E062
MNNENEFLGWDTGFIAEESTFVLLPAGEYQFTVTGMERKIYDGKSQNIPNGAPYAELSIKISGEAGSTTIKERLYMMKKFQWKLTEFFSAIGQTPVIGQPFNPNWSLVVGSQGRAKVEINNYISKGEERQNNQIKEFIKSSANQGVVNNTPPVQPQQSFNQAPTQHQPSFNQQQGFNQAPQQTQNHGGFQAGAF